jgi:polysaccharide pyruvyl transferase WcaK-like protein
MFRALVSLARTLELNGRHVLITCNDPADINLTRKLFATSLADKIVCPRKPEDYFQLLSQSRAVVTGRLHTAVVSFSLGIPFVLIDADQRTRGFLNTYQLETWSVNPAHPNFEASLHEKTDRLLDHRVAAQWEALVTKRDLMHARAIKLLQMAFSRLN